MITVYFATNRDVRGTDADPRFGIRFNDKGPQELRFGRATVEKRVEDGDVSYHFQDADLAPENLTPRDPRRVKRGSARIFEELRQKMLERCVDVLVLIHGYATSFAGSMERGAELADKYLVTGPDGRPTDPYVFVFAWPSGGSNLPYRKYFDDRDDAQASGRAMARALLTLLDYLERLGADERCRQRLHLVTHSMGAFALRHALLALHEKTGGRPLPRAFHHVFLMSPDEDDDAFENDAKLGLLPQLGQRIHVYHSEDDDALWLSDVTKRNPDRLGASGPRNIERLNDRITAVDAQDVDYTGLGQGEHRFYLDRDEVVDDAVQVLADQPLNEIEGRIVVKPGRSYRLKRRPR